MVCLNIRDAEVFSFKEPESIIVWCLSELHHNNITVQSELKNREYSLTISHHEIFKLAVYI